METDLSQYGTVSKAPLAAGPGRGAPAPSDLSAYGTVSKPAANPPDPALDAGFLDSWWNGLKGVVTGTLNDLKPKSASERQAAVNNAVGLADKFINGSPEEKDSARKEMEKAIPLGGTALKVERGNYAGAAGDVAAMGTAAAAAGGLGKAADVATSYAPAIAAGAKAAAPGVASGAAGLAASELLAKIPGLEWPMRIGVGLPSVKAISEGLKAGGQAFIAKIPKSIPDSIPFDQLTPAQQRIVVQTASLKAATPGAPAAAAPAPVAAPVASAVPAGLPSGRVPGSLATAEAPPTPIAPPARSPAWQSFPEATAPESAPAAPAVPAALPSGRLPGSMATANAQALAKATAEGNKGAVEFYAKKVEAEQAADEAETDPQRHPKADENRVAAADRIAASLKKLNVTPPPIENDAAWASLAQNLGERDGYVPALATRQMIHERMGSTLEDQLAASIAAVQARKAAVAAAK